MKATLLKFGWIHAGALRGNSRRKLSDAEVISDQTRLPRLFQGIAGPARDHLMLRRLQKVQAICLKGPAAC